MIQACDHCCTKIENLTVRFGSQAVLENINLHLNCKELLALIGPNGAGKTTLLRAIIGELPSQGKVYFRVKGDFTRKPRIGYVPQKLSLDYDSPISVLDLVAVVVRSSPVWLGIGKSTKKTVEDVLSGVVAQHLLYRRMNELSGGELQRVLLAIAMIPTPDLLLLDEPVSAVDVKGLSLFYQIVSALKKKNDLTIIMATHDIAGIAEHADRMVLLNRSIIAEGTPQEVFSNAKMLQTFGLSLWNISCHLAPNSERAPQ